MIRLSLCQESKDDKAILPEKEKLDTDKAYSGRLSK